MLNDQQQYVYNKAMAWWKSDNQVFEYSGIAGSGKTFLLFEILKGIGIDWNRIAFTAYTGAAAIVMRSYGLENACTIYSALYECVDDYERDSNGNYILDPYFNKPITKLTFIPRDLTNIDLIVIDEASMVPLTMKHEIESRGKRIIATGDLNQLPPVIGDSAYLLGPNVYRMTKPMRQKENSSVVYLANLALQGIPIETGTYGKSRVIYSDEITNEEIANAEIIICGKNATRESINNNFRRNIIRTQSTLPLVGEKMICRKNNWNIGIENINLANGLIGTVTRSPKVEGFENNAYLIDFKPNMTDGIFIDLLCDYKYLIGSRQEKEIIKKSKFSFGEKMEYAYAITCHLSQGSQFGSGIYMEENLGRNIQNRLNYTGVTRFKDSITYIIQRPKQYWSYTGI